MFSCWMEDDQLAFGDETRKRRARWCEQRLEKIAEEIRRFQRLAKSLKQIAAWFADLPLVRITPLIDSINETRRSYTANQRALATLDTSSIDALEKEREELASRLAEVKQEYETEIGKLAVQRNELAYSARCRPLIPPHAGPRFRAMPAGDSAACRPP